MPKPGKCKDCKNQEIVGPRGLCKACYSYHHNHHSLDQFPRSTWKNEELMAELDICLNRGLTVRESAETIGVKLSALRQAMHRSRRRAIRTVEPRST